MPAYWQFGDGGLTRQEGLNAPTYNDVFTKFLGQDYMTGYDPALAMTLNAGGQGGIQSGTSAFLSGRNAMQGPNEGGSLYDEGEMNNLAKQLGIDTQGKTGMELQGLLDSNLGDYYNIGGMSAGWNPTGDARQGNATLYKRENGKLVPYQTVGGHLAEKGSWLQENPGILAPLAVMTGGLAYGALAGAGAGAAGGAAAGAGAGGAGITGTAGASGMAAYGAGAAPGLFATAGTGSLGAGLGGLGGFWGAGGLAGATAYGGLGSMGGGQGLLGGAQQWYNNLPKYQQSALRGAGQNFVTSGGDPKAALRGGLTGGLAGGVSDYLGGGFLGNIGGKAAGMLAGNVLGGLGGGGSAAGGGSGSSTSGAGSAAGGLGGGTGGVSGGASGLAGGIPNMHDAGINSFVANSYAPILAELRAKQLAKGIDAAERD